MNIKRLHRLFQNYIDQFEYINNEDHDENYKWRIVQFFQDNFDLEADDLAGMLTKVWQQTSNLVDNSRVQPFHAMIEYAKAEPERVRQMFTELLADDGGDLQARQERISAFITESEELRSAYFPSAWPYRNDQRSAMCYLFLNDPDHNYLYKATEVREFADCVEFLDDFGSGTSFRLSVFYRMCDELVEAIREYPALLETHNSRFVNPKGKMFPDEALHILAQDVIYSSQVYGLYTGIEYSHPDAKARKLQMERIEKAEQLKATYDEARSDFARLQALMSALSDHIRPGVSAKHRSFGLGEVESLEGNYLTVRFSGGAGSKKFMLLSSIAGHFLEFDGDDLPQLLADNADVIKGADRIPNRLKSAESALQPYLEYLD